VHIEKGLAAERFVHDHVERGRAASLRVSDVPVRAVQVVEGDAQSSMEVRESSSGFGDPMRRCRFRRSAGGWSGCRRRTLRSWPSSASGSAVPARGPRRRCSPATPLPADLPKPDGNGGMVSIVEFFQPTHSAVASLRGRCSVRCRQSPPEWNVRPSGMNDHIASTSETTRTSVAVEAAIRRRGPMNSSESPVPVLASTVKGDLSGWCNQAIGRVDN